MSLLSEMGGLITFDMFLAEGKVREGCGRGSKYPMSKNGK